MLLNHDCQAATQACNVIPLFDKTVSNISCTTSENLFLIENLQTSETIYQHIESLMTDSKYHSITNQGVRETDNQSTGQTLTLQT
jgi:hypothetical protein